MPQEESNEISPSSARRDLQKQGRRVQLTGGSTLVVSLPIDWARSVGLKPRDEVYLTPQSDMSLLLTKNEGRTKTTEISIVIAQNENDEIILRKFIAYYIAGYDIVRFHFRDHSPEVRSKLKARIREQLIGVEIVEETSEGILAQCLQGHTDLPLKRALSRMAILTNSMSQDAVNSLCSGNEESARDIIGRDDEVDRFSHFISKQLNMAVHNRALIQEIGLVTAQDCMNYRLIVKSIERIADHAVQIATCTLMLNGKRIPPHLIDKILKLAKLSKEMYDSALRSLNNKDGKLANETVLKLKPVLKEEESATDELISSRLDNRLVISLRLALESLRRSAEYSSDICEIVVNMNAGSPL